MGNMSDIDMCCKNSYVIKKNEFNIDQYQKDLESNKIKKKNELSINTKLKRNKDLLDKHIKEASNNLNLSTNEFNSNLKYKLEEASKIASRLIIKVVNSSSLLGKGTTIEINAQGIEGSLRGAKDGSNYFGYLPEHMIKENCAIDFNIPNNINDENNEQKNIGRFFQIEYKLESNKYLIRDLGLGYGTFIRLEYPLVLKDNHLINMGETFIVANILTENKENPQNQLRLKIFGIDNNGEIFYFPIDNKVIKIGRQENCDIVIQDKLLSKIHCSVSYSEDCGWLLFDGFENYTSTNGTWLYINEDFEIYDKMIFKSNQTIFQVSLI